MTREEKRIKELVDAKAFKVNRWTQRLIDKHLEIERKIEEAMLSSNRLKHEKRNTVIEINNALVELIDHFAHRLDYILFVPQKFKAVKCLNTARLYTELIRTLCLNVMMEDNLEGQYGDYFGTRIYLAVNKTFSAMTKVDELNDLPDGRIYIYGNPDANNLIQECYDAVHPLSPRMTEEIEEELALYDRYLTLHPDAVTSDTEPRSDASL